MKKQASVGALLGLLVFAIGASSSSATSDSPTAAKRQSCGTVDFGYTNASVSARRVNCPSARRIVRKWSRMGEPNEPAPPFLQVKNFLCEFSGTDVHLKLRCKNTNDSRKRVRADWGG
jgi:hypothetical protein